MTQNTLQETALEIASGPLLKNGPPVAVTSMSLAGVQLSDLVLFATLAWTGLQAGFFLYDRVRQRQTRLRIQREREQQEDAAQQGSSE